jgi:hypothetical protein
MTMNTKTQLAQWFLAGAMTIAVLPAYAVDTPTSRDAPDLTLIRAKIKAKDFKSAAADLYAVIDGGG